MPKIKLLAPPLILATLAGCAIPAVYDPNFQTLGVYQAEPGVTGVLRRHLPEGSLSLDLLGTTGHIPLRAFADVRIIQVVNYGRDTIAVIRGGNSYCPVSYMMAASGGGNLRWTDAFGDCRSEFAVVLRPDGMAAVQQGGMDPVVVAYSDGRFMMAHQTRVASRPALQGPSYRASPVGPSAPTPSFHDVREVSVPMQQERLHRVGPEVIPDAVTAPPRSKGPVPSFDPS